jgi:hypothetical protein
MNGLGGRLITMRYGGWIWSPGPDYGARERWMTSLVAERENLSRFLAETITYALPKTDEPSLYSHWMPVLDIGNAKLYRLVRN